MDQSERVTLSDELRLVPAADWLSDALNEEFNPPQNPERPDGQSPWERGLTGHGFVPLSLLTPPHVLREVLRVHLDERSIEGEENREPLMGGHGLFEGERLVLTHACCCDLSDSLRSWDNAAQAPRRGGVSYFDIGHNPDMFATWEEPWLVMNEADENAPCELGEVVLVRQWRLRPQALERAVREARQEQEAFARRLEPYLAERFPTESVSELAATLAGLR